MYQLKYFTYVLFMLLTLTGLGQSENEQVEVIRDLRLDELAKKQQQINKATGDGGLLAKYKTSSGKYKGYRLMIINTNNRDLAYQTRGQLASRFPQHKLYMAYQAPYYKLKMGDFLEKSEAEDLKRLLSGMVKSGIFIISDVISLRPEEEQRLIEKALNQE
ncbi:MAG: SPOR domain-containing protein [Chitinophagaceae bacterium]|nr:SPOR domain-containing protein [Chitinophagaceae bacterium]